MPEKFKYLLPIGLILLLFATSSLTIQRSNKAVNEFTFKRGTNISHWLSQSNRRGEERLSLFTESSAQERFFQCWRDLSGELKNYSVDDVAYELMNEPVADNPEDWNKLVRKLVSILRGLEPKRKIVIGSNRWQSANTFDQLYVPENDKNIILSFHMYEPFLLTHHTASWTGIKDYKGPVNYPGNIVNAEDLNNVPDSLRQTVLRNKTSYNIDSIRRHFAKPIAVAKKYKLPLYCGEWGCLKTVPVAARLQWYRDMKTVLEENNIGWATWDYKGGFGIVGNNGQDAEVRKILTGK